jgi:hypothetical protein
MRRRTGRRGLKVLCLFCVRGAAVAAGRFLLFPCLGLSGELWIENSGGSWYRSVGR